MKKINNGFTLVEIMITSTLLLFIVASILPIYTKVKLERKLLTDRREITFMLHDELQRTLYGSDVTLPKKVTFDRPLYVEIDLVKTTQHVKGCAKWTNEKDVQEEVCLYGMEER